MLVMAASTITTACHCFHSEVLRYLRFAIHFRFCKNDVEIVIVELRLFLAHVPTYLCTYSIFVLLGDVDTTNFGFMDLRNSRAFIGDQSFLTSKESARH